MIKRFLSIAVLAGLVFTSCNNSPQPTNQPTEQNTVNATTDQIVQNSVTNANGTTLQMTYNNTRGTATFVLNGQTIEMRADSVASGIRYSNPEYIYTEHQGNIRLMRNGQVVFEKSNDDKVKTSVTNSAGTRMDMEFDNTDNTAKFTLNDETIELKADTMASGIQYSNDEYVYTEHQGKGVLKKNGRVVFETN